MESDEQIPMLSSDAKLLSNIKELQTSYSEFDEESTSYIYTRAQKLPSSLDVLKKSIHFITLIISISILVIGALALTHIDSYLTAISKPQTHRQSFMLAPANDTTAHTCHDNGNGHQECTAAYMEAGVGPHGYDFEAARALDAGHTPGPVLDKKARKDRAFVTVLTHVVDVNDWYFTAVRLQAYRLRTRHNTKTPYPFIVLLPHDYPAWKSSRLAAEGVTVRHVSIIKSQNKTGVERWAEAYTKLHIFNMTEYDRIVYLDADIIILQSPEGLMGDPIIPNCNAGFPTDKSRLDLYSDTRTEFELGYIMDPKVPAFNAGVMIIRPDVEVFNDMMEMLQGHDYDTSYGDQALLNKYYEKAIRDKVTSKVVELPRCYNTQWSEKADTEASIDHPQTTILLHRKAWWENDDYFTKMFFRAVGEMEGYWIAQLEAES